MKETEERREGNPRQTGPELEFLSSTEIDEYICFLEKDLKEAIETNETVEQERLLLQKQIIELQLKKKDLDMIISKSHARIKTLSVDLRIARSKFWSVRNEGR